MNHPDDDNQLSIHGAVSLILGTNGVKQSSVKYQITMSFMGFTSIFLGKQMG
jgi:hypothetical protein